MNETNSTTVANLEEARPSCEKRSELETPVSLMDILIQPEAVKAIEQLINNVMNNSRKGSNAQRVLQAIGLFTIVGAVVGLSVFDQLDASAGVILGSLAGYLFGKGKD